VTVRNFVIGFYKALSEGRSIEDAFRSGRNATERKTIPQYLTPSLVTRSNASSGEPRGRSPKRNGRRKEPASVSELVSVLEMRADEIEKAMLENEEAVRQSGSQGPEKVGGIRSLRINAR